MEFFCFHSSSIFSAEDGRVLPVVFLLGAAFVAAAGVWVRGRFKPSVTVKAGSSASASSNGPKGTAASSPGKRSALRLTEHSKPSVSARIAKKPRERKSADAPVIMSVYKYSDEAQDWLYQTREAGKTLYACILGHDAYPSVCFGLVDRLGRFLAENAANGYPGNLAALREAGIALVLTKNEDPDQVGYVAYRPVFYVVGDLENSLVLFDEFMAFAAPRAGVCRPPCLHRRATRGRGPPHLRGRGQGARGHHDPPARDGVGPRRVLRVPPQWPPLAKSILVVGHADSPLVVTRDAFGFPQIGSRGRRVR